jgi:exodeoxyribonuclease X
MILRCIDTETTGFPPDCKVVEIATVDLVSDGVDPISTSTKWTRGRMWSSLINPGIAIPPEASGIHHIVDDMVADAPSIDAVKASITDGLEDGEFMLAAHEARFEKACLPWLTQEPMRWVCTRKTAMVACPDAPNHKNMTLRYWLNLKLADPSLAHPHRSLGDIYVTAAILRRLLAWAPPDELAAISAGPIMLPRLFFGEHAMKPLTEVPLSYWTWIVEKSKGPWDEDVMHTAKEMMRIGRSERKSRSPV